MRNQRFSLLKQPISSTLNMMQLKKFFVSLLYAPLQIELLKVARSLLVGILLGGGDIAFCDGIDGPPTPPVIPHNIPPEIPLESSGSEWTWSLEGDSSVGGPNSPGWTTLLEEPTSSSASSVHGQSLAPSAGDLPLEQAKSRLLLLIGAQYRHYLNRGLPEYLHIYDTANEEYCANIILNQLEMNDQDSISDYESMHAHLLAKPDELYELFRYYGRY